ncbi:MAG: type IV secretory system conjugative DNA transfer family protein [Neisseriaceae bacterium]|nr:type IV secretory system conjugative DNA transfer family protein [Neisseriaceae bacterium]
MENSPKKAIILLSLLLVLAFAAIYGSGYLYHLFVAVGKAKQHGITTFRLPEIQTVGIFSIFTADKTAHPDAFKWALIIVGGVAFFLFLAIASLMNPKKALYGAARFANIGEITKEKMWIEPKQVKQGGLWADDAIVVGQLNGKYIGLSGQQHAYLAAPTRSGKGTGVVNPVALSYAHSLVVLDIKKELFNITAAFRRANGHKVFIFDPFDPDGRTARWNPLSYIRRDYNLRETDVEKISQSLIRHSGKGDPVWTNSARGLLDCLILYLLDKEENEKEQGNTFVPTLREVYNLTTGADGEEAFAYYLELSKHSFVSKQTKQAFNAVFQAAKDTFLSVTFTLNTALKPYKGELVTYATSGDDFDLRNVRREKTSIYFAVTPDTLEQAAPLLNLFYTQLINENTRVLPQDDNSLKYQCLLLMDEGASPGRIEILPKAISYMAGYNVRMLLIVQSPAQLREKEMYDIQGTQTILSNCALKILYTPNDYSDAEEYSKLLGKTTVKQRTSRTMGKGRTDETETQNSRDLMLPQELLAMSSKNIIVRKDGLPYPIWGKKNCYYKDKNFLHFQQYKPLKAKKSDKRQVSGSLNNTAKKHYYDDIQAKYPNEFSGLYYGDLRHLIVKAVEETLVEVIC